MDPMMTGGWLSDAEGRGSRSTELRLSCHVWRRFLSRFLHQPQAKRSLPLPQLLITVMETPNRLRHRLCAHHSFSSSRCCPWWADTSPPNSGSPPAPFGCWSTACPPVPSRRRCHLERERMSTAKPWGVGKHHQAADLPGQTWSATGRERAGAGWASLGGCHWVGIVGGNC